MNITSIATTPRDALYARRAELHKIILAAKPETGRPLLATDLAEDR